MQRLLPEDSENRFSETELQISYIPNIENLNTLRACWPHKGVAADLVRQLKYHRVTGVVTIIADALASITPDLSTVSTFTWVPCTPQRRRSRGFDPAELLTRAVARRLHKRAVPYLRRLDNRPQTSRNKKERLIGPRLASHPFNRHIQGQVVIIDDVCTTGSTLKTAATVLRLAGAQKVIGLVATVADRNNR